MDNLGRKKSRKYTDEFKRQAVQLAEELGSVTKAAKQLGVAHANLHNWRTKLRSGNTSHSNSSALLDSEEENKRLKKEIAELKKVNYILKAAAAVFSQGHLS
jgi:transposase